MASRSANAVLAGVEKMAGASLGRVAGQYRSDIAPLIRAIKEAKSVDGLKRALGPALVKRMKTTAVETSLSQALTQAALIGKVAGTPQSRIDDRREDRSRAETRSTDDRKRP